MSLSRNREVLKKFREFKRMMDDVVEKNRLEFAKSLPQKVKEAVRNCNANYSNVNYLRVLQLCKEHSLDIIDVENAVNTEDKSLQEIMET
jgi:hypothetical protein